jgi:hypothetical protein
MTSLNVILVVTGASRSRGVDYLLGTAEDRQVPPVVAHQWSSESATVRFHGSECQGPAWWPSRAVLRYQVSGHRRLDIRLPTGFVWPAVDACACRATLEDWLIRFSGSGLA